MKKTPLKLLSLKLLVVTIFMGFSFSMVSAQQNMTPDQLIQLLRVLGAPEEMIAVVVAIYSGSDSIAPTTQTSSTAPQIQPLSCTTFNNDLGIGLEGSSVVNLQTFLVEKNYLIMPAGVPKGYYGNITQQALMRYQSANNIFPANGILNQITRNHINNLCRTDLQPDTQTEAPDTDRLYFSSDFMDYSYTIGDRLPRDHHSITVTNGSDRDVKLRVRVPNQPNWLNTSYTTEEVTIRPNGGKISYGVFVDPAGVRSGRHSTELIFSGNFSESPKRIPITLRVHEQEDIVTEPSPSITAAQSPAGYRNILRTGDRATINGNNLSDRSLRVVLRSGSNERTVPASNQYSRSLDFIIPDIAPGGWDLFVKRSDGTESNRIRVEILEITPSISSVRGIQTGDSSLLIGGNARISGVFPEGKNYSVKFIGKAYEETVRADLSFGNTLSIMVPSNAHPGTHSMYVLYDGQQTKPISVEFVSDNQPAPISVNRVPMGELHQDGIRWDRHELTISTTDQRARMWNVVVNCPSNIGDLNMKAGNYCGYNYFVGNSNHPNKIIVPIGFERLDLNPAHINLRIEVYSSDRVYDNSTKIGETEFDFTLAAG